MGIEAVLLTGCLLLGLFPIQTVDSLTAQVCTSPTFPPSR
jgi:hypothetical protein